MRGLKSLVTAALALSSSVLAAAPFTTIIPKLKPLQPVRIDPSLLLPTLIKPLIFCSDANISQIFVEQLNEATFSIRVEFKDLILKESGSGKVDKLACSLYSKLPSEYGEATSMMGISSSRYQMTAITPQAVNGQAHFGIGVVDAGSLAFAGDHYLVTGVAAAMEGNTYRKKVADKKPLTGSVGWLPPVFDIHDFLAKLPIPLIMKTTGTSFGQMTPFSRSGERTIDLSFDDAPISVHEGQYIVNQFTISIEGNVNQKQARAQLNWLELVLVSELL